MKFETTKLSVCSVCLYLMAYGEIDFGLTREARAELAGEKYEAWDRMWSDDLQYFVPGSEDYGFCQSDCDACGDGLHGDRHEAWLMVPVTSWTDPDGDVWYIRPTRDYWSLWQNPADQPTGVPDVTNDCMRVAYPSFPH